jgi:hypothetical protein
MPKELFRRVLETAIDDPSEKKARGPVQDVEMLLQESTLSALDRQFVGCYAVFIHDAEVDTAVSDYVNGFTLTTDTGNNILALYIPRRAGLHGADAPPPDAAALVDFVRHLFPQEHIQVPGIVLLARLATACDPVYVPLGGLDGLSKVAARARSALACAAEAAAHYPDPQGFSDTLGRSLALADTPYSRAHGKKVAEYLIVALRMLWNAKSDIIALVKLGTKLM